MTSEPGTRGALRDRDGAFEFEPHHCFACGELNEHGLHLRLHAGPERAWAELQIPQRFQGWESVAHGGVVCTLLDEVMGWAVIGRGTWGVTARLNVAFRRPIAVHTPIRAEGWVVAEDRRAMRTAGHVLDGASGEVLATGEGTFVAVPSDQLERLRTRYGLRRLDGSVGQPDTTEAAALERAGDAETHAATDATRERTAATAGASR